MSFPVVSILNSFLMHFSLFLFRMWVTWYDKCIFARMSLLTVKAGLHWECCSGLQLILLRLIRYRVTQLLLKQPDWSLWGFSNCCMCNLTCPCHRSGIGIQWKGWVGNSCMHATQESELQVLVFKFIKTLSWGAAWIFLRLCSSEPVYTNKHNTPDILQKRIRFTWKSSMNSILNGIQNGLFN